MFRASHVELSSNEISGNGGDGVLVGGDGSVKFGTETGPVELFSFSNTTSSNNGGFGLRCEDGGSALTCLSVQAN